MSDEGTGRTRLRLLSAQKAFGTSPPDPTAQAVSAETRCRPVHGPDRCSRELQSEASVQQSGSETQKVNCQMTFSLHGWRQFGAPSQSLTELKKKTK